MPQTLNSLDRPLDDFRRNLQQCIDIIIERYRTMHAANAHPTVDDATIRGWFEEALPEEPTAIEDVLQRVDTTVVGHATLNIGTKMFAYVMSGGNQVSIAADMIASALSQNVAKWHLAPAMTEIEQRVIAWTAQFMQLDSHSGGAIVSSGSSANLTGLTVARNMFMEKADVRSNGLFGLPPLTIYGSDQTHASIEKSVEVLGIGSAHYRRIASHNDQTVDLTSLAARIVADERAGYTPFCVVGNAGTVNTGAIDPLLELAGIANEHGMWFHVDGAYGGLAAALVDKRKLYHGIELADSIALDYHKWLYQPYEVGCTLVKDWSALKRTYHKPAEYLDYGAQQERFDVSNHHFDLSRNAKAFKVWMSFKAYGAERFRTMISKDIALAKHLAERLRRTNDFELVSEGSLAIVCFRYLGDRHTDDPMLDQLNIALLESLEQDGRVFITGTKINGRQVIRACIINHRMQREDIDYLFQIICELAETLLIDD